VDGERFHKLLVTASKGNFSFQANDVSREKALPTGSFATIFDDKRTHTTDALSLASVSYDRALLDGASFSTRLHAGRYNYDGEYAYYADHPPNRDLVAGAWWGLDVDAARKVGSRQYLTVGAEYRDNFRQMLDNYDPEPLVVYSDISSESVRYGVFAQDEIKLAEPLMLIAGARVDRYEGFGFATSPRAALIYTPDEATTFKLLAGRAFRAPNEYELNFQNFQYKGNPSLKPERIETLEFVAQRFIGGGLQLSASAFRNRLSDITSQLLDLTDSLYVFANVDKMHSKGLELGLEVNRGRGIAGQLSYSLQRTQDIATDAELTNSPQQMVQAQLRFPIVGTGAITSVDAQYMSARRTLGGNLAASHFLTNLSLFAPKTFGRFDLSASIYNVFAVRYGDPVPDGFSQDTIQQDGRSFRVRSTFHY
jgi:iron complex outermembrane receptor protein